MTNRAPGRSPGAGRAARGLPIEEYALIGDGHTAALVGRNGSIDWLCLPRFDSGACFAALLGNEEHGFWRIAPASDAYRVTRCYRGETLVLETEFHTGDGVVRLVDCMPRRSNHASVVRVVEGVSGRVPMRSRRWSGSGCPARPGGGARCGSGCARRSAPVASIRGVAASSAPTA